VLTWRLCGLSIWRTGKVHTIRIFPFFITQRSPQVHQSPHLRLELRIVHKVFASWVHPIPDGTHHACSPSQASAGHLQLFPLCGP
jgi:hypothetical protein